MAHLTGHGPFQHPGVGVGVAGQVGEEVTDGPAGQAARFFLGAGWEPAGHSGEPGVGRPAAGQEPLKLVGAHRTPGSSTLAAP
jgi:hypothetical protein